MATFGTTSLPAETAAWVAGVSSNGGGFEWNSIAIANNLVSILRTKTYYGKIVYFLPMLGKGINAVRFPLIDKFKVGIMANTAGFVDADFNQSLGLQGALTKRMTVSLKASQLGVGNFGGVGFWDNNINTSGATYVFGSLSNDTSSIYNIYFQTGHTQVIWGTGATAADTLTTPTNGHYYGQGVSATSRVLYKTGVQIVSSSASTANTNANEQNIIFMGDNIGGGTNRGYAGRCSVAYLTDGTFTADEINDMHLTLQAYLVGPTGRP